MQSPMGDAPSPTRRSAVDSRLLAALLLGVVLLALSALIHAAAAATLGGGWASLGALWLTGVAVIVLVMQSARNTLAAWRRMCLVNGVASLGLIAASSTGLAGTQPPELVWPHGPVLGFAVTSALLTIAGSCLAAAFFAAWHLLSRHGGRRHGPA